MVSITKNVIEFAPVQNCEYLYKIYEDKSKMSPEFLTINCDIIMSKKGRTNSIPIIDVSFYNEFNTTKPMNIYLNVNNYLAKKTQLILKPYSYNANRLEDLTDILKTLCKFQIIENILLVIKENYEIYFSPEELSTKCDE